MTKDDLLRAANLMALNGERELASRLRAAADKCVSQPDPFREAVHALVRKMEICHDDPAYKSVWTINQIHAGPYTGPNYATELAAVKGHMRSLAAAPGGEDNGR